LSKYLDNKGSQAYVLWNDEDIIIAFRGTEPNELQDIIHDIKIKLVPSSSKVGKVHAGFREALDKIWPDVFKIISELTSFSDRKIYFTGHSLGGAKATLAAARCARLTNMPQPAGLYTYGSPKVGNRLYTFYIGEYCIPGARWVNNVDIVTKVPIWPYRHIMKSNYMNHDGWIKKYNLIQIIIDRLRGFFTGLKRGKINYFVNHGIQKYIDNIEKNINY
jgi:triacylglycerol lipase